MMIRRAIFRKRTSQVTQRRALSQMKQITIAIGTLRRQRDNIDNSFNTKKS
jgi:hypothetical protein